MAKKNKQVQRRKRLIKSRNVMRNNVPQAYANGQHYFRHLPKNVGKDNHAAEGAAPSGSRKLTDVVGVSPDQTVSSGTGTASADGEERAA